MGQKSKMKRLECLAERLISTATEIAKLAGICSSPESIGYSFTRHSFCVQMSYKEFFNLFANYKVIYVARKCELYPYEAQAEINGLVFYTLLSSEDARKLGIEVLVA